MAKDTTWIVMAETEGEGEASRQLWSQTFRSKKSAEDARMFLESVEGCRCIVIEDSPERGRGERGRDDDDAA